MTGVDTVAFRELVTRVAAGRGKALSADAIDGLWELLDDLEFREVERGLLSAAKVTRFFPSAPEIRAHIRALRDADAVRPSVMAALQDGEVRCQTCDDTGWAPCVKDAAAVYGAGATVPAVRVCGCRASNALYLAKRAGERRVGGRASDEV